MLHAKRLSCYKRATGRAEGDEVNVLDFINWVQARADDWCEREGVDRDARFEGELGARFDEHLAEYAAEAERVRLARREKIKARTREYLHQRFGQEGKR